MRLLLVSLGLAACGGEVEDGSTMDASPLDGQPDAGDPLAALSDEFGDPATLAGWTPVRADGAAYEIENGALVVTATSGIWHEEREHVFLSRGSIDGDFVMRAHVRALRADDPSMPPFLEFNSIGIMARDPRGDVGPEWWAINFAGFQAAGLGTRTAITLEGTTLQELRGSFGADLELVLCRIGDEFRTLYLTPEYPDMWINSGTFEWPEFPQVLDVGIALDTFGAQPHLRGEVDWLRFAVPSDWEDCSKEIPPIP